MAASRNRSLTVAARIHAARSRSRFGSAPADRRADTPALSPARCRSRLGGAALVILLLLPGCTWFQPSAGQGAGAPGPPREPPKPATLHVYLAAAEARPGYAPAPGGRAPELYIAPAAALTRADLDQARALHSPARSMLQIVLNPLGRARLTQVTRANPGGLLAVYIDDELVATLPISPTATDGRIQLVGLFSRARTEELAARLNARVEP